MTPVTVFANKFEVQSPGGVSVLTVRDVGMKEVPLPPPTWRQRLKAWWRGEEIPRTELVPDVRLEIHESFLCDGPITITAKPDEAAE